MDELKSYRLTSMEDPTDEQLSALMAGVAEDARKSTRRAKEELRRRMEETQAQIMARHKANKRQS